MAFEHDGRWYVVDYKSNRLDGADPATLRDGQYGLQEAVYALALLERGEPVVDVHFAMLDADVVLTRTYDQGGVDAVRATVGAAVEAARSGPYVPRPGIVCEDCPVLGLLCAGPDLDHLHGPPDQY